MKKLLSVLLTLVFVFSLVSCADDSGVNIRGEENKRSDKVSHTLYESKDNGHESSNTISRDRAIEIALNHAGISLENTRDLEAELDRERGSIIWEVDFEHDGYEYSYDIDAESEEIIHTEKEYD